ncbi:MAG: hypothetical protein ACRDYF_04700, partial [Acidimicrobiia bacterium]
MALTFWAKPGRWSSAAVPQDGLAVDENVLAGPAGTGGVEGGVPGPELGGAVPPEGVPGPLGPRPGRGRTAIPTMGRVRLATPAPRSGASPKARSSPEVAACQYPPPVPLGTMAVTVRTPRDDGREGAAPWKAASPKEKMPPS